MLVVTLVSYGTGVSWEKAQVCLLYRGMADAWSQQALAMSFILIERIYSWAPESVVRLHARCSGQFCWDCCCKEKIADWQWRLQHTGVVAEVFGSDLPVCPQEEQEDLLGVCSATCKWCLGWVDVTDRNCLCEPPRISPMLRHSHR